MNHMTANKEVFLSLTAVHEQNVFTSWTLKDIKSAWC